MLSTRAPKNVVVVAMANKLARIAWAVLSSGNDYRPQPLAGMTGAEKTPSAWKRYRAPTFPHHGDDDLKFPTEVCTG